MSGNPGDPPIPINRLDVELRVKCACTDPTLVKWLRRYLVGGKPIGAKVGGQWRVWPDRLEKFLLGQGQLKPRYRKKGQE